MALGNMDGLVAVVTGGGRGIGAAAARQMAAAGAQLAIVYRNDDAAAGSLVSAIRSSGGRADAFKADVSDPAAVKRVIADIARRYGRIDALVNSAAVLETRPVGELTAEHFDRLFHTNTRGALLMIQEAVPHFPASGGHIVNMASSLVFGPIPLYTVYTASKAAVVSMTLSLSKELGPRGIRVNCVSPGLTRTDMTRDLPPELFDKLRSLTPLGRLGTPEDVAKVIAFFASPDSGWVTGRTIETEGGIN
jgi:3-oxoacyl-[acyl-carrier protein] reductase